MADFTFFPDYESNAAFLDVINFTEGCEPGNGLCENLARYNMVTMEQRKAYINSLKAGEYPPAISPTNAHDGAMSIDGDAATALDNIAHRAYL